MKGAFSAQLLAKELSSVLRPDLISAFPRSLLKLMFFPLFVRHSLCLQVSKDNGGAKVQVVAHSMGGLVALAAVNKRHDLFHSCLFGGSPFQPCAPMFIGYIVNGRPAGLNKKLLTGRVHFTWSSAYGVLPINGTGIVDSDGTELTFDFFDVDTWVTERWGLFHPDHPQTLVGQPDFEEYRCAAVFEGVRVLVVLDISQCCKNWTTLSK